MQTAFVSLFYIFINSSLLPGYPKGTRVPAAALHSGFNESLYEFLRIFLISENSLKFAIFCWGNEFSIYDNLYSFALRAQTTAVFVHESLYIPIRICLSSNVFISYLSNCVYTTRAISTHLVISADKIL